MGRHLQAPQPPRLPTSRPFSAAAPAFSRRPAPTAGPAPPARGPPAPSGPPHRPPSPGGAQGGAGALPAAQSPRVPPGPGAPRPPPHLVLLQHLAEARVPLRDPAVELGDAHGPPRPAPQRAPAPAPLRFLPARRADSPPARAIERRAERPAATIECAGQSGRA